MLTISSKANPNLNPWIMAKKLAVALETGWHFRRAAHSAIKRIMDSGAKGAQVIISGKLGGDRAKREKITVGKIKYSGKPKEEVRVGFAQAKTKPGIIGVTVKILPPDAKLPDEITIIEPKEELENEGNQGEGSKESNQ